MKIIYAFCAYTTHILKINTAIRILYRLFSCAGDSHENKITSPNLSRVGVCVAHAPARDALTPSKVNFGGCHA